MLRCILLAALCACHSGPVVLDDPGPDELGPDDCADPKTWFLDDDEDGFGTRADTLETCGEPEAGWSLLLGDCDDADAGAFPGAIEVCDNVDQDCDGDVDAGAVDAWRWYPDRDRDGAIDTSVEAVRACQPPTGLVREDAPVDCDDEDPTAFPGAVDVPCDGIDQDCDGVATEAARVGTTSFADVESAILAASGETVSVCPGSHRVSMRVEGSLDVRGVGEGAILDGGGERVLDVVGSRLTLHDVELVGGTVEGDGGAVRAVVDELSLERVIGQGGRAGGRGGSAYLEVTGVAQIRNSAFADTAAEGDGGAIYLVGPRSGFLRAELISVQFSDSVSGGDGGALAVLVESKDGRLTTRGLRSRDTRATGMGGAVSIDAVGDLTAFLGQGTGPDLARGQAAVGGLVAIRAQGEGRIDVFDGALTQGEASERGGLLDVDVEGDLYLHLYQVDFTDAAAPEGGLVALRAGGLMRSADIDEVRLSGGDAASGAALLQRLPYGDGDTLNMAAVNVEDNVGGPAIDLRVSAGEAPSFVWSAAVSSLYRNRGGGIRVGESTATVRLTHIKLGAGVDDNDEYDVLYDDIAYAWPDAPLIRCEEGTCTAL